MCILLWRWKLIDPFRHEGRLSLLPWNSMLKHLALFCEKQISGRDLFQGMRANLWCFANKMWRLLEKAIQSSCQRSARLCHRNIVKGFKDYGENVSTRVSILGWDDPKVSAFSTVCGHYVDSSSSSKRNSCDGGVQLRFGMGNWKKVGFLDGISEVETFPGRGFMCKAGLYKDAEEMEENEYHESEEDGSESDEFEGDFTKVAAAPVEQEERTLLTVRELLWKRIVRVNLTSPEDVMPVIHKWREQGKELRKGFLIAYITRLRKRARYKHALEISEWVVKEKPFELDAMDYGFRIDLTARIGQMDKAEKLFNELPPEHKNSLAYSTLLMNYVKRGTLKKAEDVFEEMKKLGLLTSPFAINQMLRLYQSKGMEEKIPLLLDQAKLAGIQPDIFRYNILMDVEGKAGNIEAMEKILEEAKANLKVKLDAKSHGIIASAYISANMLDKAELALKRMETGNYVKTPSMYNALLKLYGQLKSAEEVERIWKLIKKLPRRSNYSLACLLTAFSSLDSAEGAEKTFKDMEQMIKGKEGASKSTSSRKLKLLGKLYEKFGLKEKTEELKKDMPDTKVILDAVGLHTSIEEFLKSDDLEKAYDALNLNKKGSRVKPLFDTYILILDKYAEKGDVKTSEKIFEACRGASYIKNTKLWNTLLKAYIKADLPAYGFRQRMYADRVYPTSETQKLLDDLKQQTP